MKVTAVSGFGEKQAACFLVETQGARLLLDLGEGPVEGSFPDLSGVGRIDAILVSHGHVDHVGGLHLANLVGSPPIYGTATVRALGGHPALAEALDLPLAGTLRICGVEVETGRAGHAPGGVWMRIGGPHGMLYSGDFSRESLLYPHDAPLPARVLVVDASYGTYDTPLSHGMEGVLATAMAGPVLLPAPSTGRGLEIGAFLHERGMPVGLCPAHWRAAEIALDAPEEVVIAGGADRLRSLLASARRLDGEAPPSGAMLAANASATGGVAGQLVTRFANDPAVAIIFTGHVERGTAAAAMIDAGRAQFIRWNVHPTLQDLQWLVDAVTPEAVLPAFLSHEKVPELAQALPTVSLMGPAIDWQV